MIIKLYFRWQGKLQRIDLPHIERQGDRTEHIDPSKYDKLLWVEDLVDPFLSTKKITKKQTNKKKANCERHLSYIWF